MAESATAQTPPPFVPRALAGMQRMATRLALQMTRPWRKLGIRALDFADRLLASSAGRRFGRSKYQLPMILPWYLFDEEEDGDLDTLHSARSATMENATLGKPLRSPTSEDRDRPLGRTREGSERPFLYLDLSDIFERRDESYRPQRDILDHFTAEQPPVLMKADPFTGASTRRTFDFFAASPSMGVDVALPLKRALPWSDFAESRSGVRALHGWPSNRPAKSPGEFLHREVQAAQWAQVQSEPLHFDENSPRGTSSDSAGTACTTFPSRAVASALLPSAVRFTAQRPRKEPSSRSPALVYLAPPGRALSTALSGRMDRRLEHFVDHLVRRSTLGWRQTSRPKHQRSASVRAAFTLCSDALRDSAVLKDTWTTNRAGSESASQAPRLDAELLLPASEQSDASQSGSPPADGALNSLNESSRLKATTPPALPMHRFAVPPVLGFVEALRSTRVWRGSAAFPEKRKGSGLLANRWRAIGSPVVLFPELSFAVAQEGEATLPDTTEGRSRLLPIRAPSAWTTDLVKLSSFARSAAPARADSIVQSLFSEGKRASGRKGGHFRSRESTVRARSFTSASPWEADPLSEVSSGAEFAARGGGRSPEDGGASADFQSTLLPVIEWYRAGGWSRLPTSWQSSQESGGLRDTVFDVVDRIDRGRGAVGFPAWAPALPLISGDGIDRESDRATVITSAWRREAASPPQEVDALQSSGSETSRQLMEVLRTQARQPMANLERLSLADLTLISMASATRQMAASPMADGLETRDRSREPVTQSARHAGSSPISLEEEAGEIDELAWRVLDELRRRTAIQLERSGDPWVR